MFPLRDLFKQGTVSLLGLSLFGLLSLNAAAQAPTQSVPDTGPTNVTFHLGHVGIVGRNDPVKITRVLLGDKEVSLDTPIPVSGQWFRTIGIVVQNVSPKPVIYGTLMLLYSKAVTNTLSNSIGSGFPMGRPPAHYYMQKDGTERPHGTEAQEPEINVLPNASLTFIYSAINYAALDQKQAEVSKQFGQHIYININLAEFGFSDGSRWQEGYFFSPADAPTVWKIMTPAEFFGSAPPANR